MIRTDLAQRIEIRQRFAPQSHTERGHHCISPHPWCCVQCKSNRQHCPRGSAHCPNGAVLPWVKVLGASGRVAYNEGRRSMCHEQRSLILVLRSIMLWHGWMKLRLSTKIIVIEPRARHNGPGPSAHYWRLRVVEPLPPKNAGVLKSYHWPYRQGQWARCQEQSSTRSPPTHTHRRV